MSAKRSKRLVIDASIARAAGGPDATFPTSKHCRDFLQDVVTICHRIVMTTEINEEWRRHQSTFARRWLVSMYARKKVYWEDTVQPDANLRARISQAATSEAGRAALLKDCCLVEAALATDWTVTSLDDRVRQLLGDVAQQLGELRPIVWVNPDVQEENCHRWLQTGADPERERQLGAREI